MRERVVEAALPHIAFDGWTMAALRAGADAAGLDESEAAVLFPRGPMEAIDVHMALADRRMIEEVSALDPAPAGAAATVRAAGFAFGWSRMRRIVRLFGVRRRGYPLPHNAPLALRSLYRTVDTVWLLADDRSTDFSTTPSAPRSQGSTPRSCRSG